MATLFRLPLLGQTMQEGTILKWHKQEGDPVEGWETLFEVMTDKVNMEVEPAVSGVLRKILAPEGTTLPVGSPVAIIGRSEEAIDDLLATCAGETLSAGGAPVPAEVGAAGGNGSGSLDAAETPLDLTLDEEADATEEIPNVSPRARARASEAGLDWRSLRMEGSGFEGMIVERDVEAFLARMPMAPRLTPLAARLAGELGVSSEGLTGSGPGGKITADDVRAAAGRREGESARGREREPEVAPSLPLPLAPSPVREIRITGIRKVIADRLAAIYHAAPHVPLRAEIDMTDAGALREQLIPEVERRAGVRLTFTDLIAAATVTALREHSRLNATLEGDLIRVFPAVHLGVAVALEDGLVVPVLRDADRLSLTRLAVGARDMAERARRNALKLDELAGGTFTITNLGSYGVDSFDPILNPPQVAILGVGRIAPRVVPFHDSTAVRQIMGVTLVFDHRALDGAPAARFLARLKALLEAPASILLGPGE